MPLSPFETLPGTLLPWTLTVAFALLLVAFALALVRLVRGPSLPDRVVALDLVGFTLIAFMALYAVVVDQPVLVDAGLVLGALAFLGTIAFARYVERAPSVGKHDEVRP